MVLMTYNNDVIWIHRSHVKITWFLTQPFTLNRKHRGEWWNVNVIGILFHTSSHWSHFNHSPINHVLKFKKIQNIDRIKVSYFQNIDPMIILNYWRKRTRTFKPLTLFWTHPSTSFQKFRSSTTLEDLNHFHASSSLENFPSILNLMASNLF